MHGDEVLNLFSSFSPTERVSLGLSQRRAPTSETTLAGSEVAGSDEFDKYAKCLVKTHDPASGQITNCGLCGSCPY